MTIGTHTAAATPWAHSANDAGDPHLLVDHLKAVGRLSRTAAEKLGMPEAALWAGRLHDLGKADPRFQEYLRGERSSGPPGGHAAPGALLAHQAGMDSVALAVLAHHTGLQDRARVRERLLEIRSEPAPPVVVDAPTKGCCNDTLGAPTADLAASGQYPAADLPARWLLSVLVDADRLDTERHFDPDRAAARSIEAPTLSSAAERFAQRRVALAPRPGDPMNPLRELMRSQVVSNLAGAPVGVYTLTAPTGSGKTLTVTEAALAHAERHGLERLVVAAPFTSVVTQTADELQRMFGDDTLLEHHSNTLLEEHAQTGDRLANRLAAETWDRPVVATTSVQLLETLFSNRPSKLRKLHRLARAVIVIDEVQSIPWDLMEPAVRMLAQISEAFGSTVVLCTATQPPIDRLDTYTTTPRTAPRELVDDLGLNRPDLERAATTWHGQQSWDEIADLVAGLAARHDGQALAVLNTIADAGELYGLLAGLPGLTYLSTMLCPAHRRRRLSEVRSRLAAGEPVLLVSTQMIEAGVDVDFPTGFRAIGPLTSITQTAGRINRHGLRPRSEFHLADPADGRTPPGDYKIATSLTRQLLDAGTDPLAPEAVRRFYEMFAQSAAPPDPRGINELRARLNLESVADAFRMIADDTISVAVPYDGFDPDQLATASPTPADVRRLMRAAQPYLVELRHRAFDRARDAELVEEIPGLSLFRWNGVYADDTGLQLLDTDRSFHL